MNQDTLRQVGPVVLSILVIIAVAVIRNYSRTLAAVTATMPIAIPLSLWIIYSGFDGDRKQVQEYTDALPIGILSTLAFTVAVWFASRAGWKLWPMIGAGYAAWGVSLGVMLLVRRIV
jgi:hypothetical protein